MNESACWVPELLSRKGFPFLKVDGVVKSGPSILTFVNLRAATWNDRD